MYKSLYIPNTLPSIGVVAYLYTKNDWINSQFIQRLDVKYNINHVDHLVENGYLSQYETEHKGLFGKAPKYYKPTQKLLSLNETYVKDKRLEKTIDSGIHILNGWFFNHWKYNYSQIELNIPNELIDVPDIYINKHNNHTYLNYFNNSIKPFWGSNNKDYFLNAVGIDDKFSGRHHNFFTNHKKELRNFLFNNNSVEVDVAFCQPLLLGDLLYKSFGNNDYSNLLMNDNYDIYTVLGRTRNDGKQTFNNTVFSVSYPNLFATGFPEAYRILRGIKQGEPNFFYRFCSNKLFTTDDRIALSTDEKNYNRAKSLGELHYKSIALMLQLREVEIMRKVWSELKKQKIVFVPIHDSVIVEKGNSSRTEEVMKDIFKQELDSKFRIRIKIKK